VDVGGGIVEDADAEIAAVVTAVVGDDETAEGDETAGDLLPDSDAGRRRDGEEGIIICTKYL
jgi:hypothetical protein